MHASRLVQALIPLLALAILSPRSTLASPSDVSDAAGVSLAQAPAERAQTVSGNKPSLQQPTPITMDPGETADQTLYATDVDGDPLTFSKGSGPSYVTVTTTDPGSGSATGNVHLAPVLADGGPASAGITVSDGVLTDHKALSITVTQTNTAPVLSQPSNMMARVGETVDQLVSATDADGDPLAFTKSAGPSFVAVSTEEAGFGEGTGKIRATPASGDVGTSSATVRVSDGNSSDQKSFNVTVRANVAPILGYVYSMSVAAASTADQTLYGYDNDGDPLTFAKVLGPSFMAVTTTSPGTGYAYGNIHLTPAIPHQGSYSATVSVSDGVLSAQQSFSIFVQPPNVGPVLSQPANVTMVAGEISEQVVTATDANGDYIYIYKGSGPAYMTVSGYGNYGSATATIRLQPGSGDVGNAIGYVSVSDYTTTDTKSFAIAVQAGNFPTPCPSSTFSAITLSVGYSLIEVQSADLNGDGAMDIVAELSQQDRVEILLGNNDGTFVSAPTVEAESGPVHAAIADFNRDDNLDLAIVNLYSNNVSVFLGDGAGAFGPKRNYAVGSNPRSVAAADVNRDGKLDLLVTNEYSNSVSILRGVGDGTFGVATAIVAGSVPFAITTGDWNGDGAPDVAVTNGSGSSISVFLNNGGGGFARTDYTVGVEPLGIVSGDVNGDLKLDLAVSSAQSNMVSVFLGVGDGTFLPRHNFGTGSRPGPLAIADLNGDGDPDLAVTSINDDQVSIMVGDGAGAFGPRTGLFSGDGPFGIANGDFDDDLRADLAVANYYAGSVTLFLNASCAPDLDHPPVVRGPKKISGPEASMISFGISATDPDGPSITSLMGDFSSLPLGHNAALTPDATHTAGTFTWTPTYMDARGAAYPVTFTATNLLSGSWTTKITVTNTNRPPVAHAGGPYTAFVGSPLTLNGAGSADPDGEALTFLWIFGDGTTGTGPTPAHTYLAIGLYGIALTASDGDLTGIATTTADIVGILQSRAFTSSGNRSIRLGAGKPQWCVNLEPVGKSYSNVTVDLTSIVMKSPGTGSVSEIHARADKVSAGGDHDGNGVEEINACFSKEDLRMLFSNLRGNNTVSVTIEGTLFTGGIFRAQLDIGVTAAGGTLAASISPNPLNPEAVLTFTTERAGFAKVDLFDVGGRMVRRLMNDPFLPSGYHDVRIDGRDARGVRLASGVYYFRIESIEGTQTGRITVLK